MSTISNSSDTEVKGPLVYVIHVDESGVDPVRTVLALATKDDISFTVDEDDEQFDLASERRSRRYRTNNTADLEVSSVIDVDMEAAALIGIVDGTTGALTFDEADRELLAANDEYIELAYGNDEPLAAIADAELIHRFEDLELTSPEIDPSSTPPLMSWTWWVEGAVQLDYTPV